jgi:peptidoglycan/LPS O-acetylase OafA/YrhL
MSENKNPGNGYKPDIDGLRAISVLAVLAFHAGLPLVSGGFVGVDVFFVISGYLISKLLLVEYAQNGRFSLVDFWARRVRRLAPALLLVTVAVLLVSVFALQRISGEVGGLARGALATLLINANHFFMLESGNYFGAAAETNPLLHMWSLSVEEQFYLAWPLILFFSLKHLGLVRTRYLTLLILVASFALCCVWTFTDPSKAFYLMPSRAWELMAGAMLAFPSSQLPQNVRRSTLEVMSVGGVLAIAVSVLFVSGQSFFPGPAAVLPVVGAMLLLAAGSCTTMTFVQRALASKPFVYVGKISYPLYLWHWPILVIMRSNRLYQESIWLDMLGILVALVLASLTFEYVEKTSWKTLQQHKAQKIVLFGFAGNSAAICMAVLLGAWARFGWGYSAEELRLDASRKDMPQLNCMFSSSVPSQVQLDACFAASKKPAVLLWGDSHANHWRPAFTGAAIKTGLNAAALSMKGPCNPLPGPVGGEACVQFNKLIIDNLSLWRRERGLVGIVISARWPAGTGTVSPSIGERSNNKTKGFFDKRARSQAEVLVYFEQELRTLFKLAKDNGLRVLLVLPSPVQKFAASHCLSVLPEVACSITESELRPYVGPAEDVVRRVAGEFDMVRLIEPRSFMCRSGVCPVVMDGTIVYTDDDHISNKFSNSTSNQFEAGLAWLAQKRGE